MTRIPTPSAWLRVTAACGLVAFGAAGPLAAEPVPLDVPFLPLDVEAADVCDARPPAHAVLARWSAWDGATPDARPTEIVRRDLRILREQDAVRWFDTIEAATALLRESDPSYLERDWLMDRIDLALAAGRPEMLDGERLVERFLASDVDGSPAAQLYASRLIEDGTGVARDEARARDLLVAAAYGGQTEALLRLAALTSDGTKVEGWDIDPTLAVTLAFGGLVGDMDPLVCDRINRIASAYRLGEVVAPDLPLAEQWYRLSAKLGDPNAAWQVAQMHMRAEGIDKDNDVLLAHLEQAAAGGLPFAQAELGRILELGALAPRDLARARELYAQAASVGFYEGQLRLASLLRDIPEPTDADRAERVAVLEAIADRPTAWALVELGDMALADKGRWSGEAEAMGFYQRAIAVAPDDLTASLRLATLGLRHADTYAAFLPIAARLGNTVVANGSASGMDELVAAMTCRSPAAPHLEHAAAWRRMREAAGDVSVDAAGAQSPASLLAQAQSQAMAGRASSFAVLLDVAGRAGIAIDADRLRELSAGAEIGPTTEQARVALGRASTPVARAAALDLLREAAAAGEGGAREELLAALMEDGVAADEAPELRTLAEALAPAGNGQALQTLAVLDGGGSAARERVWTRFRDVVDARGDFDALLFAMPFLPPAAVDDYLDRARTVMPCNTLGALALANATRALGRQDETERWIAVADAARGPQDWLVVAVADAYRTLSEKPDALRTAVTMLNDAREGGNRIATLRLASLAEDEAAGFDLPSEDMAGLLVDLIDISPVENVPSILARVRRADPEVQALVEARVDVRGLYEQAAAAGSPVAQLELAKILRADTSAPLDLQRYADLLIASAQGGQAEAMYLLSDAYSLGLGVEPSLERSRRWLFLAAEAGNQQAADTVRLLQAQGATQ